MKRRKESGSPPRPRHAWLRAMGKAEPPETLELHSTAYRREQIFKHDFFAATAVYVRVDGKTTGSPDVPLRMILKTYRNTWMGPIPLKWTGRVQVFHESRLYRLLDDLPGVPKFMGRVGATGFAHEFVPGEPLTRDTRVSDDFFPTLTALISAIHSRGAAYVDMEKRENILVDEHGRPCLIDFQISYHIPRAWGGNLWPMSRVRRFFQGADRYHLLKHRRRLRPDQLTPEEIAEAERLPLLIRMHRVIFRPVTVIRRRFLIWIGVRRSDATRA